MTIDEAEARRDEWRSAATRLLASMSVDYQSSCRVDWTADALATAYEKGLAAAGKCRCCGK